MSGATTAVLAATAVAGLGYSIYSGQKASSEQKEAQQQAEQQAQQQSQAEQQQAQAAQQQAQVNSDAVKAQTSAMESQAAQQQQTAQEQFNQANQQGPNTSAMLSAIQQAAQAGNGGTMLTGPQGVQPGSLTLGKSTLLGQ